MKVTTKNEFKDAIERALNENNDSNHGHWIGPDGTIFDVSLSHDSTLPLVLLHLLKLKQISQADYDKYARLPLRNMDNVSKVYDFIFRHGWLRGVKSGHRDYYVNGRQGQTPTNTQLKWLKDYGIESKRNVLLLPRSNSEKVHHIHNIDDLLESSNLTENVIGKVIINVDIQPDYKNYFSFKVRDWIKFLNENYDDCQQMVFLYNGSETIGTIDRTDYSIWLLENGLEERIVDQAVFFDKGFAFFRDCMDHGIDSDDIVDFLKFMLANGVRDSRHMTKELWKEYISTQKNNLDREEIISLLENADAIMHLPELMDELKRYNGIVLTGGGINDCLKEVEIALKVLGKNYEVLTEFTY